MKKLNKNRVIYFTAVLLACAIFLLVGNRLAGEWSLGAFAGDYGDIYQRARVLRIIDRSVEESEWTGDILTDIIFSAEITHGPQRGSRLIGTQTLSTMTGTDEREVREGDRVLVGTIPGTDMHYLGNFLRSNTLLVLAGIFFLLVVLFGGIKGFNSLVALGLIGASIFMIFIPALFSGRNIYALTMIISVFAVLATLAIVVGPHKKTLTAIAGCLGGVAVSAGLMLLMTRLLHLTGDYSSDTMMLQNLPIAIDLQGIVFAGVILGAVGAIMDVAMSMSSSLWELREADPTASVKRLFSSGMNIGRDVLGTMLNTLVLAYVGSSLTVILLLVSYSGSVMEVLNMEMIVVEILRALVGSFGMLLTIPLTAGICAWLYSRNATTAAPAEPAIATDTDEDL
ncbi:MAG: YibE/F family protein [Oscillospiraceae bacterium]|nr:YibE/F family protein [Oscillospiraceae bacterium]